jgi:hypothetical protein
MNQSLLTFEQATVDAEAAKCEAQTHSLTLNETKTRLLDVRAEGFKFLGFGVSWRRGKSGRDSPMLFHRHLVFVNVRVAAANG